MCVISHSPVLIAPFGATKLFFLLNRLRFLPEIVFVAVGFSIPYGSTIQCIVSAPWGLSLSPGMAKSSTAAWDTTRPPGNLPRRSLLPGESPPLLPTPLAGPCGGCPWRRSGRLRRGGRSRSAPARFDTLLEMGQFGSKEGGVEGRGYERPLFPM